MWFEFNADGIVLGRLASEIAKLLQGKHKPIYAPHMDTGDHVVVVNAKKALLTGGKERDKFLYRHSGYPGGLRTASYLEELQLHPERTFRKTVQGMLPKGRLGHQMLTKLHVYGGPEHPHAAQKPVPYPVVSTQSGQVGGVLHMGRTTCDTMRDVGLRISSALADMTNMTVVPIAGGGPDGGRIETDEGGLLNLFSDDRTLTVSWSTELSARAAFAEVVRHPTFRGPNPRQAITPLSIGFLGDEPWDITPLADGDSKRVEAFLTESFKSHDNFLVARLEAPLMALVWQLRSPLQKGGSKTTFGFIVDDLNVALIKDVFDRTASESAKPLRQQLVDALEGTDRTLN